MDRDRQHLLGAAQGRQLLRMPMNRATGFTLVELMIGIAVLFIMAMLALPNFSIWIQNTQIRTAGEAILNGLQLARAEAIRRNANMELRMDVSSGWTVRVVSTGEIVQSRLAAEGSGAAAVTIAPAGTTKVTFDSFGTLGLTNNDGSPPITEIKIDAPQIAAADSRELCILIRAGGNVRMCDPQVASTDTRTCGAVVPPGCL
jgi:type IV fimbrial biogenesis protein FimT